MACTLCGKFYSGSSVEPLVNARGLLSIITTCDVDAYGVAVLGCFAGDVITDCDDIVSHSSKVSLNLKSSGKLSILHFIAWFKTLVAYQLKIAPILNISDLETSIAFI